MEEYDEYMGRITDAIKKGLKGFIQTNPTAFLPKYIYSDEDHISWRNKIKIKRYLRVLKRDLAKVVGISKKELFGKSKKIRIKEIE
jgi:hypothetical protein